MVDVIALSSVLVSGAVAGGSLLVTYRNGREQREHETDLAFEERAWEQKSTALFTVISSTRTLLDGLDAGDKYLVASVVSRAMSNLEPAVAGVEAYASAECRDAFSTLRRVLQNAKVIPHLPEIIQEVRDLQEAAIDDQDFDAAAGGRTAERDLMQEARDNLSLDIAAAKAMCTHLIEAARASVRHQRG